MVRSTAKQQLVALGVGVFVIWMLVAINFMMDNTNSSAQISCVKRLAKKTQLLEIATLAVCDIPETRVSNTIKKPLKGAF